MHRAAQGGGNTTIRAEDYANTIFYNEAEKGSQPFEKAYQAVELCSTTGKQRGMKLFTTQRPQCFWLGEKGLLLLRCK